MYYDLYGYRESANMICDFCRVRLFTGIIHPFGRASKGIFHYRNTPCPRESRQVAVSGNVILKRFVFRHLLLETWNWTRVTRTTRGEYAVHDERADWNLNFAYDHHYRSLIQTDENDKTKTQKIPK